MSSGAAQSSPAGPAGPTEPHYPDSYYVQASAVPVTIGGGGENIEVVSW